MVYFLLINGRRRSVDENFELNFSPDERAIVVSVLLAGESQDRLEEDVAELESLLHTLGVSVVGHIFQKRQKLTPSCYIGTGKVEEIKALAEKMNAKLVVFERDLSGPQVRNLEEMTKKVVLDRNGIILQIFSRHARTNQAKTQVEIARLEYLLPRMTGAWTHFQRQRGGGALQRGMGEKQIEIDRRRARDRISRLQKQLEQIRKEKATQRKARSNELKVAIVGYTNSGKTTLMKGLTKSQIAPKDELFATLDTSVKTIDPRTRPKILLSDTVGFIRNLSHSLIESFRTTLEEVSEADLLLHVVDVSYSHYEDHIRVTNDVLTEIGAGDVPQILIFNKVDRLKDPILPRILRAAYPGCIVVSAEAEKDVLSVRDHIYNFFRKNLVTFRMEVPVDNQTAQSLIYRNSIVMEKGFDESRNCLLFHLQATRATMAKLRNWIVSVDDEIFSTEPEE
ncbi:MAG: GTPase HflX [Proteobacteria bacterium]|nr:MAG: GTPase HflX [Pseudomonadota bacterium]